MPTFGVFVIWGILALKINKTNYMGNKKETDGKHRSLQTAFFGDYSVWNGPMSRPLASNESGCGGQMAAIFSPVSPSASSRAGTRCAVGGRNPLRTLINQTIIGIFFLQRLFWFLFFSAKEPLFKETLAQVHSSFNLTKYKARPCIF